MTKPVFYGYRPWLDGLRAVAILLVLAEHTNYFKSFPLGKIGVGIFFALSGYLITGILIDDILAKRLDIKTFYIRRLGRLMPGILATVLVSCAVFSLLGGKREILNGVFALTYTTNYAAVWFGHHLAGFGHMWSLAVEEHFYIFWPLVLLLVVSEERLRRLIFLCLLIAIAALALRFFEHSLGAPDILLYVGSLERLDSLMYGCAAAAAVRLGWRPGLPSGYAGIALLMLSMLIPEKSSTVYISCLLGIGGALLAVNLDSGSLGRAQKILSQDFLVKTGLLSYSLYIWHLPIYQIVDRFGNSPLHKVAALGLTWVVAMISYHKFEIPLREWVRRQTLRDSNAMPAVSRVPSSVTE